jgi:class 3 adenylate cyclase
VTYKVKWKLLEWQTSVYQTGATSYLVTMTLLSRIINLGTAKETNAVNNKHIRFTNAITLIVCGFIIPNGVLAAHYNATQVIGVLIAHITLIMLVFVFNARGHRLLASSWWSLVAIPAVTYYAIVFTEAGLNWAFLPMVLFLQFFMFPAKNRNYVIAFVAVTLLAYALVIIGFRMEWNWFMPVHHEFILAQRMNSLVGLPILSLAFGVYAFSTINKAEQEVAQEREKTERLLHNILPASVAERFKHDQTVLAQGFESVSVLFADIVDFTSFSEKTPPDRLLHFLNDVFLKFDAIADKYGLEKIKTIGDAYMVAGGVPEPSSDHLRRICWMALDIQASIAQIRTPAGDPLRMRIGIDTGPVTAGVIGARKFIYDLWGDTVNTASRMESHSEVGCIHITEAVYVQVSDEFICKERGVIAVKGKGEMRTWFLEGSQKTA